MKARQSEHEAGDSEDIAIKPMRFRALVERDAFQLIGHSHETVDNLRVRASHIDEVVQPVEQDTVREIQIPNLVSRYAGFNLRTDKNRLVERGFAMKTPWD